MRNKLQVVVFDIENASMATRDADALKFLNHAFESCQDMILNLPQQIDREAPTFNPIRSRKGK